MINVEGVKAMQPITLSAVTRCLSQARFDAFRDSADKDDADALARYIWNMSLAASLDASLHVVELALRNAVYSASLKIVDSSKLRFEDVPCWLDATPTLLMPTERLAVAKAKERLTRLRVALTPDRLVAGLSFDFWAALCNRPYEQARQDGPKLWPSLERMAFPDAPKHLRNRADITRRVSDVKELRNHVAHHSRLYHPDFNLLGKHADALDLLSWMNRQVHGIVSALDQTAKIYAAGPGVHRALAESILGRDSESGSTA